MAQIGVDLGIFRKLSSESKVWTADELSEPKNADPTFVSRALRYLASFNFLIEMDEGLYKANETTQWLATPGGEGGIKH